MPDDGYVKLLRLVGIGSYSVLIILKLVNANIRKKWIIQVLEVRMWAQPAIKNPNYLLALNAWGSEYKNEKTFLLL